MMAVPKNFMTFFFKTGNGTQFFLTLSSLKPYPVKLLVILTTVIINFNV